MYQNQEIEKILRAIKLISLTDRQYEKGQSHATKKVAICSRKPRLVCDVCSNTITKSLDHLTHLSDGTPVCCNKMWNQTVCPEHLDDGTPICFGCMRFKTSDETYINLGDGRETCLDCYSISTAIFDIGRCEHLLIHKCHEFFQTLNMDLPNDVPVFLVDTKEMARLCDGQITGMDFGLMFEGTITSVANCSRKRNRIVVEQESHECRTGVAILFGLPKIMTQAILTHEMMHVYFRSKGIESGELERKLEEGMCQVVGWKWLDWLEMKSSLHHQTKFLRKLIETYKFVVEKHNSDEYGEGFREVQRAVAEHGLQTTIDHLITEKKLPDRIMPGTARRDVTHT